MLAIPYSLISVEIVGAMAASAGLTLAAKRWKDVRGAKQSDPLHTNENLLSSIYNTVDDAIFNLNVEAGEQYRFLSVNHAFCRVTGLRLDQVVGKTVSEVVPEPSLTMVLGMYRKAIDEKAAVHWEETSDYPTGRLTGEVSLTPVFDKKGACTHLVGSVHDITKRVRAQEALRESEERLRSIFASSVDSILVADLSENIKLCNQSAATMRGFSSPEELIGMSLSKLVAAEEYPRFAELKDHVKTHGFIKDVPYTALKKNGDTFDGELSVSVLKDGSGKPVGFVGITRDITARKAASQKLDEQRRELLHLSRVSTLSELSSSLAHELNQPLLGIRSNAQAAQRFLSQKDPDLKELGAILDDIIKDNKRAADVIAKLRGLYKKATYEFTSIDMNSLIGEVLSMVRSHLIINSISVTSVFEDHLPIILGDKVQLQQVILNLVMNSIDSMESRPGERVIRIKTARANGEQIVISVEDNGAGIDAKNRARLFTPFFTTKEKGMGMGLVIIKTIVESHGGTIWADEHPGPGAAFHFRLPIAKGNPASDD